MNCESSFALLQAGFIIRFYAPHCPWSKLSFPRRPSTPLTLLLLLSNIPLPLALFCIIIPRICSPTGWTSFLFPDVWITYPSFKGKNDDDSKSIQHFRLPMHKKNLHQWYPFVQYPSSSFISYTSLCILSHCPFSISVFCNMFSSVSRACSVFGVCAFFMISFLYLNHLD